MLDFKKIQQESPKSWDLLKKWVEEKIYEMNVKLLNGAPLVKSLLPEVNDMLIESVVKANIRNLFDFFDGNKIEIEIYKGWKYYIDSEPDEEFNSRLEAEIAAFTEAFKHLEGVL